MTGVGRSDSRRVVVGRGGECWAAVVWRAAVKVGRQLPLSLQEKRRKLHQVRCRSDRIMLFSCGLWFECRQCRHSLGNSEVHAAICSFDDGPLLAAAAASAD